MKRISKSDLTRYRRTLGKCTSVREAAEKLGVRPNTLTVAFYREGERASDFLKKVSFATLPPPPPEGR